MSTITMDKEILIRVPSSLYRRVKQLCQKEYKSVSALIRELLLDEVGAALTQKESEVLEKHSQAFHRGEGLEWRKIKRG